MATAFLYCRLSPVEAEQFCENCKVKWTHRRGPIATCPKCGREHDVKMPDSIESQAERLTYWCKAKWSDENRPTLVLVKETGTAFAAFSHRPESSRILAVLKPGDFLLVTKYDRGWRNSADWCNTIAAIEKAKATLIVAEEGYDGSTAMGKCMATFAVAMAQLERDRISERMKASHAYRRARGQATGATPFGKRVTICTTTGKKILVDDPQELRMAKWVYIMRFEKRYPWRNLVPIAKELGFRNRAGRPLTLQKLMDMGTNSRKLKASGKLDEVQ